MFTYMLKLSLKNPYLHFIMIGLLVWLNYELNFLNQTIYLDFDYVSLNNT